MKALIIFALIAIICSQNSNTIDNSIDYECPDDKKIKIGEDVCAIAPEVKSNYYKFYIKKKSCGKKKKCISDGTSYFNKNTGLYDYIYKRIKIIKN